MNNVHQNDHPEMAAQNNHLITLWDDSHQWHGPDDQHKRVQGSDRSKLHS